MKRKLLAARAVHFVQGIGILIILCVMPLAYAQDAVQIRPHAGTGTMGGAEYQHAGARILLNASEDKKYGVEWTKINTAQGDYVAAGVVLEAHMFGWFNTSLGSIGYFGQGNAMPNQPGFVFTIGWEPEGDEVFKPYVAYRHEVIFANQTMTGNALSLGLSVGF